MTESIEVTKIFSWPSCFNNSLLKQDEDIKNTIEKNNIFFVNRRHLIIMYTLEQELVARLLVVYDIRNKDAGYIKNYKIF